MGLALHWEFNAQVGPADAARLIKLLHAAAKSANFASVSEIVEARADVHSDTAAGESEMADRAWALSTGMRSVPVPGEPGQTKRVTPVHVVAFRATSAGAEDAAFGLASYANESGYRWQAGCDTQGAARRGGPPAFLAAHRAVVAVLDKARALGIKVVAKDDGEFWETRDQKRLLDKLDEWQVLTAALTRGNRDRPACTLRADVLPRLEATRRPRRDQNPIEELEG